MKFKVNQRELNRVLKNIDRKSKEVQTNVIFELEKSAQTIRNEATKKAPTDMAELKSSISVVRPSKFSRQVVVRAEHAPYVEFGTGAHAAAFLSNESEEMRNYAMKFYKNGLGTLPSNPYLFPSVNDELPKLETRIKRVV